MNVPPYVIFGDRTLRELAEKRPDSVSSLKKCYGIGENKAEKFGMELVELIKENCRAGESFVFPAGTLTEENN